MTTEIDHKSNKVWMGFLYSLIASSFILLVLSTFWFLLYKYVLTRTKFMRDFLNLPAEDEHDKVLGGREKQRRAVDTDSPTKSFHMKRE